MADVKNISGEDFAYVVQLGRGVKAGELVKGVDDELFRDVVWPPAVWEVRNKPDFAALTVEEEREQADKAAKQAEKAAAKSEKETG